MISALGAFRIRQRRFLNSAIRYGKWFSKPGVAGEPSRENSESNYRSAWSIGRCFSADRSGAALVEFAMTGAMFLLSIMWLLEVGLTYMTTLELEAATKDVARVVRTRRLTTPLGANQNAGLATEIPARVCGRLVFAVGCTDNIRVIVRSSASFAGLNTGNAVPNTAPTAIDVGKPDHYVIVIAILESPLTVFGGSRFVRAAAVTQNEP